MSIRLGPAILLGLYFRSRGRLHTLNPHQNIFLQMVMETKSSLESGIIGSGHRFAASRLDAQRNTAGWVGEQMGGLSYLESMRSLVARVDADWPAVQADLEAIRWEDPLLFSEDVSRFYKP